MPQSDGPRLDGRNGAVWRGYLLGQTQEALAAEHGISQQRISQILGEVRASIPDDARTDAALLDLERLDMMLTGLLPAAVKGDPVAARAALQVLARRAKQLGLDAAEPLSITIERRLDLEGQLVADALAAALDVLDLSPEQRMAALGAAQQRLLEPGPENNA